MWERTGEKVGQAWIVTESDGNKLLCYSPDPLDPNEDYHFNVNWVPEDQLEWLANVYADHLQRCHNRAVRNTKIQIRAAITELFKLIGINTSFGVVESVLKPMKVNQDQKKTKSPARNDFDELMRKALEK